MLYSIIPLNAVYTRFGNFMLCLNCKKEVDNTDNIEEAESIKKVGKLCIKCLQKICGK